MRHLSTNNRPLLGAAVAGLLLVCGHALAAIPIQHWTQTSGAKVYLVESPSIPMVDVRIDFDAGERRDPEAQAGLADVTAGMTAKGVSAAKALPDAPTAYPQPMDENQLGQAWADLGAGFDAGASRDRMSFSLRSLTDPELLPKAIDLAARQLGEPSFPDDVWQRERQRMGASIREANTKPGVIAGHAFAHAVYGNHPYGYETTEETLSHIGVQDMRALYEHDLAPCRAKVSVVGAVTRAQADAMVTKLLARLPSAARCDPLPPVPEVAPLAAPITRNIPFASAQAHVLIGQPGYRRSDPDHFPLFVGNYSLGGGGFVSRLTHQVRELRGLSYSVYSYFSPGMEAGAFIIGLETRPDQAQQAIQVARDVLDKYVADGPTPAELQAAKDNLINGFPLLLDSNRKLIENVANIAWYDLPLNYLDTWVGNVQRVTTADVKAAFQRKLQPQRMVTVVVGAAPSAK